MSGRALTLTGMMVLFIPATIFTPIALIFLGLFTLLEFYWVPLFFVIGICVSSFIFGLGIPMALWRNDVDGGEVEKIAKAIILSGIITIAVGVAMCLVIGFVLSLPRLGSASDQLTYTTGILAASVLLGVGFPMIIVGIILAWISPHLYSVNPYARTGESRNWDLESSKGPAAQQGPRPRFLDRVPFHNPGSVWVTHRVAGVPRYPPDDEPQPGENQPDQEGDACNTMNNGGGVHPDEQHRQSQHDSNDR